MTLDEIITAVDRGLTVCWSNDGYVVERWAPTPQWPDGPLEIVCQHNGHAIGLTWMDGVTLNGDPDDFYIKGAERGVTLSDGWGPWLTDEERSA